MAVECHIDLKAGEEGVRDGCEDPPRGHSGCPASPSVSLSLTRGKGVVSTTLGPPGTPRSREKTGGARGDLKNISINSQT